MGNKINLSFYKNNDIYIYDYLKRIDNKVLALINSNPSILYRNFGFFYNETRKNLLESLDLSKDAEVLEVNACLGAVTKFLCEKASSVTAIEFSLNNAKIIENRLKDKNNLEIIVGDLKDIKFNKKYDIIFISELLEASNIFFDDKNSVDIFIDYFKNLLKEDGIIIFSINNRYGIKNWCGSRDDYTGEQYDTLYNYPKRKTGFKAYSKPELETIFSKKFNYVKFYYPTPDNYCNAQLLSDSTIKLFEKKNLFTYNMVEKGHTFIDQAPLIGDLLDIGKFDFFANSFLIIVSDNMPKSELLYSKHLPSSCTRIVKNNDQIYAEKLPLDEEAKKIFNKTYDYYVSETNRLEKCNIKNIKLARCIKKDNGTIAFDLAKGERFDILVYEAIRQDNFSEFSKLLRGFKEMIYMLYPDRKVMDFTTQNMEKIFGVQNIQNVECVKDANFDMNFSNIFKDGDNYTLIDYDKVCPYYLPLDYIVYKGIRSVKSPYNLSALNLFNEENDEIFRSMIISYYKCSEKDMYFDL